MLRNKGHPICLFGERPEDRRERLRHLLAREEVAGEENAALEAAAAGTGGDSTALMGGDGQGGDGSKEKFYTPASDALKESRAFIATRSFERAQQRLLKHKRKRDQSKNDQDRDRKAVSGLYRGMTELAMNSSQIGDTRPLAACAFSPDPECSLVCTGSWSSLAKIWDRHTCEETQVLRAHTDRVLGVKFHPKSKCPGGPTAGSVNIATASADSTCKLWSLEGKEPLRSLEGHLNRLSRVDWHPSGRFVGTTCFDTTWRLWDVETGDCVLLQEGHARETYGIAFQGDGAVAATGDLGGVGRVWDLRSGRSIYTMQGHVGGIIDLDFSPNGYTLASCSDDHTVRVWDLRKKQCVYTIPAHSKLVSIVKFFPVSGEVLMTASFDNTAKFWGTRDWRMLSELAGHEGHIMGADVSQDEKQVVTCSYDRTWKIWCKDEEF